MRSLETRVLREGERGAAGVLDHTLEKDSSVELEVVRPQNPRQWRCAKIEMKGQ